MCYLFFFCLHCCLINIHIFDYPDSRLSGLFTEVPTSPDNRGSTVFANGSLVFVCYKQWLLHLIAKTGSPLHAWIGQTLMSHTVISMRQKIDGTSLYCRQWKIPLILTANMATQKCLIIKCAVTDVKISSWNSFKLLLLSFIFS